MIRTRSAYAVGKARKPWATWIFRTVTYSRNGTRSGHLWYAANSWNETRCQEIAGGPGYFNWVRYVNAAVIDLRRRARRGLR